jgi:predicted hydrocarbon binding protein
MEHPGVETKTRGVVSFGRPEGSLTWTPHAPARAIEDALVTRAFQYLVNGTGLKADAARELGRAMGRVALGEDIGPYVVAFSHLGLGRLTLAPREGDRFALLGHDLAGSHLPHAAVCSLALGFIEGAVAATTGTDALGAEMRCRSRGDAECVFYVRTRATPRRWAPTERSGEKP